MGAPVGPTGCSANLPDQERRPYGVGLAYGFSDTRLIFSNDARYRFQQSAYTLSFVASLDNGLVLGGAVGPHMGGRIEASSTDASGSSQAPARARWDIDAGVVWAATVGRRFFGTELHIPYLLVIGTFSGSSTSTTKLGTGADGGERRGLHALDAKADLSMGWTLGEAFSPYLAVRAFGGPVFWRHGDLGLVGSDLYHVSVACGFNLLVGQRGTAYFDGAFLGMRGISGGVGLRF